MHASLRLPLVVLVVSVASCEQFVEKSSNPLSPTVAGPMAGISIDSPRQISPGPGVQIDADAQPLSLLIENPATNTMRTVVLGVQVGMDASYSNLAFERAGVGLGGNGQTSVRLDRLASGRTYFWRVKGDDGANSSDWSPSRSFEVMNPVVIGVPSPKSPIAGARTAVFNPLLTVVNGSWSGPVGSIVYQYQISEDQSFTAIVVDGVHVEGSGGESNYLSGPLNGLDKLFFWRVRIVGSRHAGEWSRVESLRTPASAGGAAPGPSLPPPGSVSQCGPPALFNPQAILECHRSFYGTPMSSSDAINLLRGALRAFNAAGVPGGPFGLLRKTSGHNCDGYSCDVICAGQGSAQRQWDVLINGDVPSWGGSPATVANGIRVDFCEIP